MSNYTGIRPVAAEGARIGLVTCLRCGAAVIIDGTDRFDALSLHDQWHDDPTTITRDKS